MTVTLSVVHTEPPAIHQLQGKFSYTALVPVEVPASGSLSSVLASLCTCLSPQFERQWRGGCDIISVMGVRRVVDFAGFYTLEWSDDF